MRAGSFATAVHEASSSARRIEAPTFVPDGWDPCSGEVLSQRTLTGKVFWLGGDTYRQIIGQTIKHAPLNVSAWERDPKGYDGGWVECDTAFTEQNGRLVSGPGWYQVTVDPTRPCAIVLDTLFGERVVTELTGLPLRRVTPERTTFGLIWRDIAEDFDIELHTRPGEIEWFRRLKSDRAPRAWAWDVVARFRRRHTIGWNAVGWDNERGTERRWCDEMFWRKHHRAQLVIEPTLLFESADVRHWSVQERWTGYAIQMEPVTRIRTLADRIVYPVYIDLTQNLNVTVDNDDGGENQYLDTWVTVTSVAYGN